MNTHILRAGGLAIGIGLAALPAFADSLPMPGFLTALHPGDNCGKATFFPDDMSGGPNGITVAVQWQKVPGDGLQGSVGKWVTMNSLANKHVTLYFTGGHAACIGNTATGEDPFAVQHLFESPVTP